MVSARLHELIGLGATCLKTSSRTLDQVRRLLSEQEEGANA